MTQDGVAAGPATGPSARFVDWELARSTGSRALSPGPKVSAVEAADLVGSLRAAATFAREPVAAATALVSPDPAPALVVDRSRWVAANVQTFAAVMDPVVDTMAGRLPDAVPFARGAAAKVAGAEAGAVLALLSSKVLGQYDLAPGGTPRLLLVAPNILSVERELGVDPLDFRRWVAMHEETHRVQFTAVPWLREYLLGQMTELARSLAPDPEQLADRLASAGRQLRQALTAGSNGLLEVFLTEEHRRRIAAVTAVMSLLEGHADVMMDEVGPAVIPTVATIRRRFDERRSGHAGLDRLLRRLLGLEAKAAQYVEGARFVRAVVTAAGLDGFNQVWADPAHLPTPTEIGDPSRWVGRVLA